MGSFSFWQNTPESLFEKLGASSAGLTEAEAARRLRLVQSGKKAVQTG
jgi:hypothetical protein